MSERIELLGGPLDGKIMDWRGGNVLSVPHIPRESIAAVTLTLGENSKSVHFETLIYCRSPRNRARFVFQPTAKDGINPPEGKR